MKTLENKSTTFWYPSSFKMDCIFFSSRHQWIINRSTMYQSNCGDHNTLIFFKQKNKVIIQKCIRFFLLTRRFFS